MDENIAAKLVALKRHPSWGALEQALIDGRDKYFGDMARKLAVSMEALDQRDIDYKRGYWDGISAVLRKVDTAERKLKRASEADRKQEEAKTG